MTIDAAKLNGTEDLEGSIAVGKYADFVVLNDNPYTDECEISDELVLMTMVNGDIVYEK